MQRLSSRSDGFSLVELLVAMAVMGILSVLVGLSVGVIREKAQAADCANKLRVLGVGLGLYVNEKGYYPGLRIDVTPRFWFHGLYPYITQEPVPTTAAGRALVPDWVYCKARDKDGRRVVGYGYNQMFGNIPPGAVDYSETSAFSKYWHLKAALIEEPGQKIVIGDNHDREADAAGFSHYALHNGSSESNSLRARRHSAGGNYLFADGHVEFITAPEMSRRLSIDNKKIFRPYD